MFGLMTIRLGELLRLYRAVHQISIRKHAEDMGVTKSTLQRLESADAGGMTLDTFSKVQAWLLAASTQRTHADGAK